MRLRNASILLVGLALLFSCTKVPTRQQVSEKKFSDEELKKFASIYQYLRLRPQPHPEKIMQEVVKKSPLSEKRFGEIMRAKFTQQKIEISPAEQKALDAIRTSVKQSQLDQKKEDDKVIINRGMTLERYYAILTEYKQSTFLQNRIYELMRSKK
ncbi:MAG TPA: hypothetical protein DCS93_08850 [Microscillaceae bacterium]|nr:hypothetical protein [Microscillaceae bacterium]